MNDVSDNLYNFTKGDVTECSPRASSGSSFGMLPDRDLEKLHAVRRREWRLAKNVLISEIFTVCLMLFVTGTICTAAYASSRRYSSTESLTLWISLKDIADEKVSQIPFVMSRIRDIVQDPNGNLSSFAAKATIDIRCFDCDPIHTDDAVYNSDDLRTEENNMIPLAANQGNRRWLRGNRFSHRDQFRNKTTTKPKISETFMLETSRDDFNESTVASNQDIQEINDNKELAKITTSTNLPWGQWVFQRLQFLAPFAKGTHREMDSQIPATVNSAFDDSQKLLISMLGDVICAEIGKIFPDALPDTWKRNCFLTGTSHEAIDFMDVLLGGDKDEKGCIVSAGYSWCESLEKCQQPWENPCADDVDA